MKNSIKNLALTAGLAVGLGLIAGCDRNARVHNEPDPGRTPGQELDDKKVTANVKDALMADTVKYPDVIVASYKGVVQLSGFVDERDQKNRAGDIASKVSGVTKVENNISLKEKKL